MTGDIDLSNLSSYTSAKSTVSLPDYDVLFLEAQALRHRAHPDESLLFSIHLSPMVGFVWGISLRINQD